MEQPEKQTEQPQRQLTAAQKRDAELERSAVMFGKVIKETESKITQLIDNSQLNLPPNYSVGNAIREAQLAILECKDKEDRPAIDVCTQSSIANAALSMAVQGLSPGRKQCYFIARGNQLCMQRSYFGTEAVAKRIDPTIDKIVGAGIHKGEEFSYERLPNGLCKIIQHKQTLESADENEFVGGYATILYNDGKEPISDVMTWKRILKSWEKSAQKVVNEDGTIKDGSTHADFTEEMIIRTVKNHICKSIINTADDSSILKRFVDENEFTNEIAEAQEVILIEGNTGELVDVELPEEVEKEEDNT